MDDPTLAARLESINATYITAQGSEEITPDQHIADHLDAAIATARAVGNEEMARVLEEARSTAMPPVE